MAEKAGERIVKSIQETREWARGEAEAGFVLHEPALPEVDVRAIRKATGMSQDRFAQAFGFSASAVRDWEQGRARPERATQCYLLVIRENPQLVLQALKGPTPIPFERLSRRLANSLRLNEIWTMEQLASLTPKQMAGLEKVGRVQIDEISHLLSEGGMSMAASVWETVDRAVDDAQIPAELIPRSKLELKAIAALRELDVEMQRTILKLIRKQAKTKRWHQTAAERISAA